MIESVLNGRDAGGLRRHRRQQIGGIVIGMAALVGGREDEGRPMR